MSEIASDFDQYLNDSIQEKKYVRLQYYTDIHEFMSISCIIEEMTSEQEEYTLKVNTGEIVLLNNVVRIDTYYAPKYAHLKDLTCDC